MSAWSFLKGLQGGGGWVNDTNQKLMDTYLKPFFLEQTDFTLQTTILRFSDKVGFFYFNGS